MSAVGTPPSSGRTQALNFNEADPVERLSHLSFPTLPAMPNVPDPEREGQVLLPRVPGYEVLREVGRGGMGVVYQAKQLSVKRLVALKMISAGRLAHRDEFIRFRLEAEMAARVHHPHVVQIFEVGDTEGHPYLAMEWVEGGTLADALRTRRFKAWEAVDLLLKLAEAVQAAHAQGIIHRDLKPGNILLEINRDAERSGSSAHALNRPARAPAFTPKITDFGLAFERDRASGLTGRGIAVGTAEYMAPEQARGTGDAVGPEADVYALGVMLYELLAQRLPLRGDCEVDTLVKIQTQEPPLLRDVAPGVAKDLAIICHKCLHKEPSKRYRTAQDLAHDLRRFRSGRPIQARPVSPLERSWLWVRRNPLVTFLLLVLLVGAAASFASLTWLYLDARTQRHKFEAQRDEAWQLLDRATTAETKAQAAAALAKKAERDARAHADAADRLADYLINGLLRGIHPEVAKFRVVSIEEMLDLAAGKVEGAFPHQPLEAADLHHAFAEAYLNLGKYAKARAAATRAVELRDQELGPDHDATLLARNQLARILCELSEARAALPIYQDLLQRLKGKRGPDHATTLLIQNNLASCLHSLGERTAAIDLIQDVLRRQEALHGPDDKQTLSARGNLGIFLCDQGRYAEAAKLLEEVVDRGVAADGLESLRNLRMMNSLARAFRHLHRYEDADKLDQQCVETLRRVFGARHPQMVFSLNNLGQSHMRQRRFAEAEKCFSEAFDLAKEVLGEDNETTGTTQYNLAMAIDKQERHAEAEKILVENLAFFLRVQGEDSEGAQFAIGGLAHVYADLGELVKARDFYQRRLDSRLKVYGLAEITCNSLPDYCYLLERMKEYEALNRLLADYVAKARKLPDDQCLNAAMIFNLAGRFAVRRGQWAEAEKLLQDALAIRQPRLSPDDRAVYSTQLLLANCYLRQKKYAAAEPLLLAAHAAQSQADRQVPARLAEVKELLVRTYEGLGQKEKAEEWRKR